MLISIGIDSLVAVKIVERCPAAFGFFHFAYSLKQALLALNEKSHPLSWLAFFSLFQLWAMRDSNPRPPACKAGALNQLS